MMLNSPFCDQSGFYYDYDLIIIIFIILTTTTNTLTSSDRFG